MGAITPRDKGFSPAQNAFAACYTGKLTQTQRLLSDAGFSVGMATLTTWEKSVWFVERQEEMRAAALELARKKGKIEGERLSSLIAQKEDILIFWSKTMQNDKVIEKRDKAGNLMESRPEISLENRIKVSELLMKYHGGFIERVETTTVAPVTAREVDIKDRLLQMMAEEGKVMHHEDITIFKLATDKDGAAAGEEGRVVEKVRTVKDWITDL